MASRQFAALLLSILALPPMARAAVVRTYGGDRDETGAIAVSRPSGGVLLAGSTQSLGVGGRDCLLVAVDAAGAVEWSRTIGGSGDDELGDVVPFGAGWLASGWTAPPGGRLVGWIAFLDATGGVLEQRTLDPGISLLFPLRAAATPDGGAVLAGSITRPFEHAYDAWILRIRPDRGLAWERRVGGSLSEVALDVDVAPDGTILVAGAAPILDRSRLGAWLLELRSDGTTLAEHDAYTATGTADVAMSVTPAVGGGVALSGYDTEDDSTYSYVDDAWVVMLDAGRAVEWGTHLADARFRGQEAVALQETPAGDWLVAGCMTRDGVTNDGFIVRLDPLGRPTWQRALGGAGEEAVTALLPAATPGEWWLPGRTTSLGAGGTDLFVATLDDAGNGAVSCPFVADASFVVTHEVWHVDALASSNRPFVSVAGTPALLGLDASPGTTAACDAPRAFVRPRFGGAAPVGRRTSTPDLSVVGGGGN